MLWQKTAVKCQFGGGLLIPLCTFGFLYKVLLYVNLSNDNKWKMFWIFVIWANKVDACWTMMSHKWWSFTSHHHRSSIPTYNMPEKEVATAAAGLPVSELPGLQQRQHMEVINRSECSPCNQNEAAGIHLKEEPIPSKCSLVLMGSRKNGNYSSRLM